MGGEVVWRKDLYSLYASALAPPLFISCFLFLSHYSLVFILVCSPFLRTSLSPECYAELIFVKWQGILHPCKCSHQIILMAYAEEGMWGNPDMCLSVCAGIRLHYLQGRTGDLIYKESSWWVTALESCWQPEQTQPSPMLSTAGSIQPGLLQGPFHFPVHARGSDPTHPLTPGATPPPSSAEELNR